MKPKKLKQTVVILAIILSFFLGRESKELKFINESKPNDIADAFQKQSNFNKEVFFYSSNLNEDLQKKSDTVYRCGQSKIYHPTTSHASFKRCKSKIYKLTIERAKAIGMRHCKCRG